MSHQTLKEIAEDQAPSSPSGSDSLQFLSLPQMKRFDWSCRIVRGLESLISHSGPWSRTRGLIFFKVMPFIYSVIMWTQYKFTKKETSGTSKYKMNFNRIKNSRGDRRKIGVDIDKTLGFTGGRSQNRAYFSSECRSSLSVTSSGWSKIETFFL